MRELKARGVEYTLILEDEETALALSEDGESVVYGDPTTAETFDRAGVDNASGVVIDIEDGYTASSILAVKDQNKDVDIITQCQDPSLEAPLKYIGADTVVNPRHLLSKRIADRVRSKLDPRFSNIVSFGEGLALNKITIAEKNPLAGATLAEAGLADQKHIRTIGIRKEGELKISPPPETLLTKNSTMIVAGPESELRAMDVQASPDEPIDESVILAGLGRVGSTVLNQLEEAGIDTTTIDSTDDAGSDITGDVTDETVLKIAGIKSASLFIVTLGNDEESILSVVLARQLGKDIDIYARVNNQNSKSKVRRAGADYVFSLPDITGRLVGLNVLRDAVLPNEWQIEVVKFGASSLPGRRIVDTPIIESDCFVIAVERNGELLMDISPDTILETGDNVILAGADKAIDSFRAVIQRY